MHVLLTLAALACGAPVETMPPPRRWDTPMPAPRVWLVRPAPVVWHPWPPTARVLFPAAPT